MRIQTIRRIVLLMIVLAALGCQAKPGDATAAAEPAANASAPALATPSVTNPAATPTAPAPGASPAMVATPTPAPTPTPTPAVSAPVPATTAAWAMTAAVAQPTVVQRPSGAIPAQVSRELSQFGIASSPAGLESLGSTQAALIDATRKLSAHLISLGTILNNDTVIKSFMKRPDMQEACRNRRVFESKLAYVLESQTTKSFLLRKEAIETLIDSKFFKAFAACPAFKLFAGRPDSLKLLGAGNQTVRRLVRHPNLQFGLKTAKIRQDL